MRIRDKVNFPGNQPFQLVGTPNKTKKHSNMLLFKPKKDVKVK